MKKFIAFLVFLPFIMVLNANALSSISNVDQKMIAPYPDMWNSTYKYDESVLNTNYNNIKNINALYKISCNFNQYWIKNLTSIWIEKMINNDTYTFNYDIKNCNLNISNNNVDYKKTITIEKSKEISKEFMKQLSNDWIYKTYWEPIVINKWLYPMMYSKSEDVNYTNSSEITGDIVIDETDNTNIDKEYQNITLLFPYKIGKMDVYSNNWEQYGITVQLNWDKISYVSAPLLNFKLVRKTSDKMLLSDIATFVSKWWNSPAYWLWEIKYETIKPVLVQFNTYNNNVNDNYLSIWLNLESSTKQQYSERNYRNIISLYKIGNNY